MLSLRTCIRLTIGILIAFAGLAITALADDATVTIPVGPAIAEKPIRLAMDTKPAVSKIENVLIADSLVEAIATDIELILPTESAPAVTIPQRPAVAEKPIVIVVVKQPIITGPAIAEKRIVIEEIKVVEEVEVAEVVEEVQIADAEAAEVEVAEAEVAEAEVVEAEVVEAEVVEAEVVEAEVVEAEVVEAEVVEAEVVEAEVVEQIEVEVLAAPVVEEPVQTEVVRGPAIAEKPVRIELVEEIIVETKSISVGPAVAEAGPHRNTMVEVVSKTELEPQREVQLNDWVSLVAPQISPPAWLVCQWLFAK